MLDFHSHLPRFIDICPLFCINGAAKLRALPPPLVSARVGPAHFIRPPSWNHQTFPPPGRTKASAMAFAAP